MSKNKIGLIGTFFSLLLFDILLWWLPFFGPFMAGALAGKKGKLGNLVLSVLIVGVIMAPIIYYIAFLIVLVPGALAGLISALFNGSGTISSILFKLPYFAPIINVLMLAIGAGISYEE